MSAFEKHYSVQQVAELWGIAGDTVRRLFKDEPGVIKIGYPEKRFKRKRFVLRIPETVLLRVHTLLKDGNRPDRRS